LSPPALPLLFFYNPPPTTEIYTLSLHDALPISAGAAARGRARIPVPKNVNTSRLGGNQNETNITIQQTNPQNVVITTNVEVGSRSEEHTSELQSLAYLVCRLLLEKKKKKK